MSPAQRTRLAQRMVAGTLKPEEMPDIHDAPAELAPVAGPSWWQSFKRGLGWESAAPAAAPPPAAGMSRTQSYVPSAGGASQPTPAPVAEGGDEPTTATDRLEQARRDISQFRDLPEEQIVAALREQGYSEDEIRQVLGSTHP